MNGEISYLQTLRDDFEALIADVRPRRQPRSVGRSLATVAVIGAIAAASFLVGVSASDRPASASADTVINAIARSYATTMGDHHPAQIVYVATTRRLANIAANSGVIYSNEPVYLIAVRGRFTEEDPSHPYGTPNTVTRGSVAMLVVDRSTYQVLDQGVSNQWPDFHGLGTVHTVSD